MVKLDLIVPQMLPAGLTGVVVTPNDAHANVEWDVATDAAGFLGF